MEFIGKKWSEVKYDLMDLVELNESKLNKNTNKCTLEFRGTNLLIDATYKIEKNTIIIKMLEDEKIYTKEE
ncbi:MAG: hypothetical protein CR959_01865 [Fusobacteriales bacterium]|nr:MAG: hypothetical protein CR959_01865 [Fusobacteriales bacterium]